MSANLEAKKVLVEEIKEKIQNSKSIAFVDYSGMTVEEDTAMRKKFREAGAEYRVYKNRLMALALNELGIEGCEDYLQGTTAVAFGFSDEVAPAKIICETAEKTKKMSIKFGILNGKSVEASVIEALSKLPSKEELVAKLLGTLQGPASALCRVLSAPTRGLAIALNAIATK